MPMAISVFMLAVMAYYFTKYGIQRETDEGVGAHLFQLLMPAQLPIIGYFALRYLPKVPKRALAILAIQLILAFAVVFPVFYFKL